jgi:uncharacterized protein (DUF2252 family)
MGAIGLGKLFDELVVKAYEKMGLSKVSEKTSEKGSEEISEKAAEKLTEETLKLSKDAMAKGTLGKALKVNFVDETANVTAKAVKINPVSEILEANARFATKNPEIVKMKFETMAESPIDFDRATAYLFYADAVADKSLASKIEIPLDGDLHLGQVGSSKTAKGKISFGFNDFDEAITGSYKWELARISRNIQVVAKEAGLSEKEGSKLVEGYVKDYLKFLEKLEDKPGKLEKPLTENKHFDDAIENTLEIASEKSQKEFIKDMVANGKFKISEKVRPISDKVKAEIKNAVKLYAKDRPEPASFFEIKDSAFLIAGKGSLGRNRYVVLLEGEGNGKKGQVILDLKEAVQPSSAKILGELPGNQAQRIVDAANYFTPSTDKYLGVTNIKGTDYVVRELSPASQKVDLAELDTFEKLKDHLEAVALITARGHSLSGKGQAILDEAGSKSELADVIATYAAKGLKTVEKQFNEFKKFIKNQ